MSIDPIDFENPENGDLVIDFFFITITEINP